MSLPENVRQFHAGQFLSHPQVQMIHRARFHADQHLILTRLWIGNVLVLKNLRTTEFMNDSGFHDGSPSLDVRIEP